MYQFNPYAIPSLICALFSLFIGFFVFIKNKKSMTNLSYALIVWGSAIWQISYFMVYLSQDKHTALYWCRKVYIGVPFITVATHHFSVSFLGLKKQKKLVYLFYFIAVFFAILSNTQYFITDVYKYFWGYYTKASTLHTIFISVWLIPLVIALSNLYRGYKKSEFPLDRTRLRYLFWALLFGYLGGLDYLPNYGIEIFPFGFLPVSVFVFATAYAIVKYRLMDIRVVITRTGIFVVVYTLVLGIPYLLSVLGKNWLITTFGQNWWLGPPLVLLTVLGIVGPFLYIYFQRRAEVIILRRQRTYQDTLKQAAREIARIHKLKRLLNLIVHIVTKTVGITHAAIYLFDETSQRFILKATRNIKNKNLPTSLSKENVLIRWLNDKKEILFYEEVNRKVYEGLSPIFKELEDQMKYLSALLIVPGLLKDNLLGFLILGAKRSEEFYTPQDIDTLSVIAHQATLAIENASLYENMEDQIRQRTEELVNTQKQLIQAEKLATVGTLAGGVAHEINNPLTAILTNVQILLATDNTVDTESKESLQLIEEATKRCRTIVQKLMTYAKKPLEPGQISKVDLSKVIKNVISFLGYQLEQEDIKVITQIKDNHYGVMGNANELEQVLTNLILNARDAIKKIKKSGNIHISLSEDMDGIKIEVKDEGVGIPKEIMPKIFDPFFTTKEVGKGTGLGLSICQSIIEKHTGKITVQSEVNKGSVFTVQLPKAKSKTISDIKATK